METRASVRGKVHMRKEWNVGGQSVSQSLSTTCEPLVLGPELAIETVNGRSCLRFRSNSSSNSPDKRVLVIGYWLGLGLGLGKLVLELA